MPADGQALWKSISKDHNWLVHRIVTEALEEAASQHARGCLVDIGCGEKVWAPLLRPYIEQHVGVDHADTLHDLSRADVIANAYETSLPDAYADTVWCTAVLEHLERPLDAVREAYRVLKPGGRAIYTVPLFWHLHEEPRDFYRYTRHGLNYLFEQAQFSEIEIRPLSGFLVTFAQEFCYWVLPLRRGWKKPLVSATIQLAQRLAYSLRHRDPTSQFTWMYLVVAAKSPGAGVRDQG